MAPPPPFTAIYVREPHPRGFKTVRLRITAWQHGCNEKYEHTNSQLCREKNENYREVLTGRKETIFPTQQSQGGRKGETYLSKMHCTSKLSTSHTSMFSSWNTKKRNTAVFSSWTSKHITVALIAVEYHVQSVVIRYLSLKILTHCCCG